MEKITCALCGLTSRDTDGIETDCTIINPENEQKLSYYQTVCADCRAADEREQFLAMTNQYYDWTSPTRRTYDALIELWKNDEYTEQNIRSEEEDYIAAAEKIGIAAEDARADFDRMIEVIGSFT